MAVSSISDLKFQIYERPAAEDLAGKIPLISANLLESTGYSCPELALALLRHFEAGAAYSVADAAGLRLLTVGRPRSLPLPLVESWITPLTSMGVPVLEKAAGIDEIKMLLAGVGKPFLFREIPLQSQAYHSLTAAAAHFGEIERWERACLVPEGTFEDWLSTNFDHKRRKEFKRLRNRLGEQGKLVSERLDAGSRLDRFIDDFLELEAAGWKAGRGTAIRQNPRMEEALRSALHELHGAAKLRVWRLTLDGRAIASLFAIVECGTATLGKIAYDEAFAKYSPGVLIVFDATQEFFADKAIRFADSNAVPDHPMINRIWRGRTAMATVLAAGAAVSSSRFNATLQSERLRLLARSRMKYIFNKFRK